MKRGGACKRRDKVEPLIIEVLRAAGWSVQQLNLVNGPDLLVGYDAFANESYLAGFKARTELAEVKTGTAKLRPGQTQWAKDWKGSEVRILRSVEDAIAWVQEITR